MKLPAHSAKRILSTSLLTALFSATPVCGATFTWDAVNGNWLSTNVGGSGNSNWNSGGVDVNTVPNSATDDAVFDQAGIATITSSVTINNLDLNDSGAVISLAGSGNTSLSAVGNINNSGTINLSATNSFRSSTLSASGTINNSGAIQFLNSSNTALTLAADVNNTASGLVSLQNNVSLNFNKVNGVFTNNGTLSLATGSSLNFSSGETYTQNVNATLTNDGTVNIGSGAIFNLNGGDVTGNTIQVSDATINLGAGSSSSEASFVARRGSSWLGGIGAAVNILVEATFDNAVFSHDGDVTNAGSLAVSSSIATFRTATLTVGAANTLTNTGNLTFKSSLGLGNTLTFVGNLDNQGQVTFEGGQTTNYSITGASHTNSGIYTLESGSIFNITTGNTPTDTSSFTNEASGRIEGTGNFRSNLADVVNEGTIAPGNSAGELTMTGRVGFTDTSILEIEIGGLIAGSEYDVLTVTDNLTLDGNLNISFLDTFYQDINTFDSFSIIGAAAIAGTFDNLDIDNRVETTDGFGSFRVTVNDTNVVIDLFVPVPEPSTYAFLMAFGCLLITAKRRRIKTSQ